jgi:hypothetical protein
VRPLRHRRRVVILCAAPSGTSERLRSSQEGPPLTFIRCRGMRPSIRTPTSAATVTHGLLPVVLGLRIHRVEEAARRFCGTPRASPQLALSVVQTCLLLVRFWRAGPFRTSRMGPAEREVFVFVSPACPDRDATTLWKELASSFLVDLR